MQRHEPTKAYVARRTAEGKTKAEIIRCLKRFLAREIWALMPSTSHSSLRSRISSVTPRTPTGGVTHPTRVNPHRG